MGSKSKPLSRYRIIGSPKPVNFVIRRGIIGIGAPPPRIEEIRWNIDNIMILFSDGLKTIWKWEDFSYLSEKPADVIALELLRSWENFRNTKCIPVVVLTSSK